MTELDITTLRGKQFVVDVTDDDIRDGIPRNACKCPVALGISRAVGMECSVSKDIVVIKLADGFVGAKLPWSAGNFVLEFDFDRRDRKPFQFQITLEDVDGLSDD